MLREMIFFHLQCFCDSHPKYDTQHTNTLPLLWQQNLWISTAQLHWLQGEASCLWGPADVAAAPAISSGLHACMKGVVFQLPALLHPYWECSSRAGSKFVSTPGWKRWSDVKVAWAARKLIPPLFQEKKQHASLGCLLNCAVVSDGRDTKHTASKCHGFVGE